MKSFCMEKAYKSFRKKGPKNKLKYPKRGKKPLSRPKVIRVGRVTRNKTFFLPMMMMKNVSVFQENENSEEAG